MPLILRFKALACLAAVSLALGAASFGQVPRFRHVFLVVEGNQSYTSVSCRGLQAVHCGEAIGSRRVMQGARKVHWPLRCLAVQHSLRAFQPRTNLK